MSNTMTKKKINRGRQRIKIKQPEKQSTKRVTFSKRRAGLFKKAGELCILFGAEVGIIVISPAGKPFCFGHPNVEAVLNRYLSGNTTYEPAMITLPVHEYNENYEKAVLELKEERKRAVKANDEMKKSDMHWLHEDIENMEADELHDYLTALQELRKKFVARYESMRVDNSAMSLLGYGYQFGEVNGGVASAYYGGYGNVDMGCFNFDCVLLITA